MVVHRAGADRAEVVDFGPVAPTRPRSGGLSADRRDARPSCLPGRRSSATATCTGRSSFAIPSAVRGYAAGGRALRAHAMARAGRAGRGAGPRRACRSTGSRRSRSPARRPICAAMRKAGGSGCRTVCRRSARPMRDRTSLPLGRLADTLERLAEAGPDDFYEGEIARSIAADVRAAGGVLSVEDLCRLPRADRAGARDPLSRRRVAVGARDDRRPDPGPCSRTALPAAVSAHPRRRLFRCRDRGAAAGLCRPARIMGDAEAGPPTSTTHITAVDREGGIAALDDDPAVELWQPLRAAGDRHPDEQRRHVVRPAARAAEFDRCRASAR